MIALRINGQDIRADVAPRTHLADFLREQRGLTGTHLGCEHGVCGACTLLIDNAPARSCIAFPAALDGASVTTIEGLEHDPLMIRLRAAFTAEHALQCGYCTPGMLVTARDIVLRLPAADEACIRLELAGNLCRCTGYAGIVRAIQRVLREGASLALTRPAPLGTLSRAAGEGSSSVPATEASLPLSRNAGEGARRVSDGRVRGEAAPIQQTLRLNLPADIVWKALQDPALIAACIPGATLNSIEGAQITGTMDAALGPIRAHFTGAATITYAEGTYADRTGELTGEGHDPAHATRLGGQARFALSPEGPAASTLAISITYTLRGPLAQFARGPVVQEFAAEISRLFAQNLEATLQGRAITHARQLSLFALLWRILRRRVTRYLGPTERRR
jgi:carbon-monoxide dehydrogenase small subunit